MKFRYLIVDSDDPAMVTGTNDLNKAMGYDHEQYVVIDTEEGRLLNSDIGDQYKTINEAA